MTFTLRKVTPTTFSVYDANETLVGRVYRDALKHWFAQRRVDGAWVGPVGYHKSRQAALAALEQA